MRRNQWQPVALKAALVVTFLSAAPALARTAEKSAEKSADANSVFMQLRRDKDDEPLALQVAIVRHEPKNRKKPALVVDLVAAVHVAEEEYYDQLNREFAGYDAVLYELVAPKGTRIPKGGAAESQSVASSLQRGLKSMLELEFQLEQIDYTKDNMVHADMSPEQFAESMKRKGESMLGTFLRMLGHAMAQQQGAGATSDLELLMALFDKNRAVALKRIMAGQIQDMEGTLLAVEGKDGSTLISERNKVALEVLRQQIAAGNRKIAIFYGAGHMSDFQKRLGQDFGLVPTNTRWLDAWDLR